MKLTLASKTPQAKITKQLRICEEKYLKS